MLPFFTAFIIFGLVLTHARHRSTRIAQKKHDDFWTHEAKANSTRKVSLDCVDYIKIPLNLISLSSHDLAVNQMLDELKILSEKRILNLTGISNTDLKLEYGSANLTYLMEYDQNFTDLARLLNKIGHKLYESGDILNACAYLEFAVQSGSDISATYFLLKKIYIEQQCSEKIDTLKINASKLNSLMKNSIIKGLES